MSYEKPLPNVSEDMMPFYEGLKEHKLLLLQCERCGQWYWPLAFCKNHENEPYGANLKWTKASGLGKVFVYNIHYWTFDPAFKEDVPYVYALIETAEGPLIGSNVIGCKPEEVKIGMPVEIVFEDITDEFTLPKFRPAPFKP
jgi:uncharacterized OB-fold protein